MVLDIETNNFRFSLDTEGSNDSIYLRQGANRETHLGAEDLYAGVDRGVHGCHGV